MYLRLFESARTEHGAMAQLVAHLHGMERVRGSNPLSSTKAARLLTIEYGAMAQLVAHLHGMERVRGSNPLSSTP